MIQHETGKLASQLYQRQPTLSSALEIETTQRCKEWPPRNRQYLQQLCHCLTRCIQWGKVYELQLSEKYNIPHLHRVCFQVLSRLRSQHSSRIVVDISILKKSWSVEVKNLYRSENTNFFLSQLRNESTSVKIWIDWYEN